MVLKKLKPRMTVYDVNYKGEYWPVFIVEIDEENERVRASWNSNPPRWCHKSSWSKWRMKPPTKGR